MTIRLRLTLWYTGLLACVMLAVGIAVYTFVSWNTFAGIKQQLLEQDKNLQIKGTAFYDNFDLKLDLDLDSRNAYLDKKDTFLQLVNYRDGVIKQSRNLAVQPFTLPYPSAESKPSTGFVTVKVEINKQKFKMLTYQREVPLDGQLVGLLQIGAFIYNEDQALGNLRTILISAYVAMLIIAFTIGLLIAGQALRPVGRVIEASKKIQRGSDLSVRIPLSGPKDEMHDLVNTLNIMLERLEKAYNELDEAYLAQRRFVSDASHELRTPLTTIRGNIDLLQKMRDKLQLEHNGAPNNNGQQYSGIFDFETQYLDMSQEAMDDISAEANRMSTLVNNLLALARADAGYVMEKEKLLIQPLVEEVVRRAQFLPRSCEWRQADLTLLADVKVYGNYDFLQQLLFIFIENAFKYTPEGEAELTAKRKDGYVGIVVRDTGIGMNPEEIPHVFERFYRADKSRGVTIGTGLGLSIANWIIDEHKGHVDVVTREGRGTEFTIWLPIDSEERFVYNGVDKE